MKLGDEMLAITNTQHLDLQTVHNWGQSVASLQARVEELEQENRRLRLLAEDMGKLGVQRALEIERLQGWLDRVPEWVDYGDGWGEQCPVCHQDWPQHAAGCPKNADRNSTESDEIVEGEDVG